MRGGLGPLKLDTAIHKGSIDKPAFIFIHGLGMDKSFWTSPMDARVGGGLFPLRAMVRKKGELKTLYHDIMDMGYTAIAWSQSRPAGPADLAVSELKEVSAMAKDLGHTGAVLIGHSRGGLIARAALKGPDEILDGILPIKALITLSSPHLGSGMAKWAVYLSPLALMIKPLLPEAERGALSAALRRMTNFFEGRAVRELTPGSDFLMSLGEEKLEGMYVFSAGGTDPSLINIKGISIPGSLERFLPGGILPEELTPGKGDGLVSRKSSVMPFSDEHIDFHLNHVEMAYDPDVRGAAIERIKKLFSP